MIYQQFAIVRLIKSMYTKTRPGRRRIVMTRTEAVKLIAELSYDQKVALNEMLKALEQKRQPSQVPPALKK